MEEKYITAINGKQYEFEMFRVSLTSAWRGRAYHNDKFIDSVFIYGGPEKAALELVKKIESNGK